VTWFNDIGLLHYHASLLVGVDRVDRLREAIHAVVRPGDVVAAALEAGVRERFGGRFTDPEDAVELVRETVSTLGG